MDGLEITPEQVRYDEGVHQKEKPKAAGRIHRLAAGTYASYWIKVPLLTARFAISIAKS